MAEKCHSNIRLEADHMREMDSYDLHSESDAEYSGRRKGRKLLAEKRRRARINQCLNDIKNIVCDAQKNDPNYEKMEKAEILESTVDYLRNVRRINTTPQKVKETVQARFQQGFSRCAEEILSYVQSLPGVSDNVHNQLRKHLSARLGHVQQVPVTSPTHHIPMTSTQHMTSQFQYSDRLTEHPTSFHSHHMPTQAYLNLALCSSPLREDRSFTDSGYGATPESQRRVSPRRELEQANQVVSHELSPADSRKLFHESRVRAWVESTWSYSQQMKLAAQELNHRPGIVWRPW